MRILKYLFLLLLLSLVALSIFVSTHKGEFTVKRSTVINSPRSVVFNYLNEAENWEDWNFWAVEDTLINITYSQNTIGKGSTITWEGKQGDGKLQTVFVKDNDSIFQKMNFDGNTSDISMSLKDTLGGTKVTWTANGEMGFIYKILNSLNGGAEKTIGMMFEKSLINLDRKLDYEINTYSVKVNGLSNRPQTFYLEQTFTSEITKIRKNSEIVFSKITNFCKQNKLTINSKPFVIYHTYDTAHNLAKISICIPIKEEIFITEGSDIMSKKLKTFQAVKTTLTGDYSHSKTALDKTNQYIKTNHYTKDSSYSHLEVYVIEKTKIKNPSKWITEIYIPIQTGRGETKSLPEKSKDSIPASKSEKKISSEF